MFKGIGNDIIAVARVEGVIARHGERFLERTFTEREREYCEQYRERARHYAGRFAAKEAIVKALGTGFREEVTFLDIEILNDPLGKPVASFRGALAELAGGVQIELSISHCKEYATAVAVAIDPSPHKSQ